MGEVRRGDGRELQNEVPLLVVEEENGRICAPKVLYFFNNAPKTSRKKLNKFTSNYRTEVQKKIEAEQK